MGHGLLQVRYQRCGLVGGAIVRHIDVHSPAVRDLLLSNTAHGVTDGIGSIVGRDDDVDGLAHTKDVLEVFTAMRATFRRGLLRLVQSLMQQLQRLGTVQAQLLAERSSPRPREASTRPLPRLGAGGPLLYSNFLKRYWRPAFKAAGIRYVTHHSARHSFVSTLQAQGVEVGLVAKLAGHANPAVTLGHYTQAVRGGAEALAVLDRAYGAET